MTKEGLPINAEILKWARTSLSLTRDDVAQRLGANFKVERIAEWEEGEASPTYSQLERLAHDIYKRPLAVFFFPGVPDEESPKTEFRTLPDTVVDGLPPEIIKLYRKAKLFQLNLEELFEGGKPATAPLVDRFLLRDESRLDSVVQAVRGALGIPMKEQSRWRSTNTAFREWRKALERAGVFVFKDAFREDDYSGFCLYHRTYPLIFVNNSMPDSRQVFTLFHELGHLLYRSGGVDFRTTEAVQSFRGYYRGVEANCNLFANELLVPREEFDRFDLEVSEAAFETLATHFSVSREVILRNYLDRGLVGAHYYRKMALKWAQQAKERREEAPGGGNYYYNQKAYLGETYINLAYSKYYQSKITADALAECLNIKVRHLPKFENLVVEGGRP